MGGSIDIGVMVLLAGVALVWIGELLDETATQMKQRGDLRGSLNVAEQGDKAVLWGVIIAVVGGAIVATSMVWALVGLLLT